MKKSVITIGLLVLVVIDVVLVYLALRAPSQPASTSLGTPTPVVSDPTSASSGTATDPSTSPSSTAKPTDYTPAPLTVMIAALDGTHAWRATAGSCQDGGARVQVTSDGGQTWSKGSEPARAIVRVQPVSATKGFVYGADEPCDLGEYVSDDGTKTWRAPTAVTGAWSRQAKDATAVVTPAEANARACGKKDVLDLARASAKQAYVLCADGTVRQTRDEGASWSDAGSVPGGLSLGVGQDVFVVRSGAGAACPGLQVVRVTSKTDLAPVGCIEQPGPAEPGAVSLSVADSVGWIAVGDETWTSADLTTWTKA